MSDPSVLGVSTLLVSALASLLLTPLAIWIAPRIGALDAPGHRKVHGRPIPRIGGIAVFGGFLTGLVFAASATETHLELRQVSVYWSILAVCATGMFFLGLVDDIRKLSFKVKFVFQILAAALIWTGGFRIVEVTHPFQEGTLVFPIWVSAAVTILWVVGITNAMNLIDGLDGLAAGVALIMTITVACIAFLQGQTGVVATSVALVGSLIGFLFFNFNPAKIFLGDSGSMFLGFTLAVISTRGAQKGPTAVAVLIPLLVMALPILDTSLAVSRRLLRLDRARQEEGHGLGYFIRNVDHLFLPDRGHLHHRLMDIGYGHRAAVIILYLIVLTLALAALALVIAKSRMVAAAVVSILAACLAGLVLLHVFLRVGKHSAKQNGEDGTDESDNDRLDARTPS
ncbi:MAG: undecaprenyl/decaprenyl-phosphate alpha-N-acetylglucosaminyl 1-phosphate transferase [Acidobacteria bacterium]|uniref:Undecaprenyl/decaprenyl-phosphate alpha-N-acetylglucosaminyl 1-phosphate transferase n=1 Tax=Candidatus Polarisedimenticola svalbardensis TaxID=2886004 RepID=A0A8J6XXI7_9BACT|nr:undecaprenyl/decaprenyl-phosphate alpha-N-acetylglucosaminyl 1-phosphate transferase [Candidatus Polarisedimenticola svalbardensis]